MALPISYAGMTGPCPSCKSLFRVPFLPNQQIKGYQAPQPYLPYAPPPTSYGQPNAYSYPPQQLQAPGAYYMTPQGLCYYPNPVPQYQAPYPAIYTPHRPLTQPPVPVSSSTVTAERNSYASRSTFNGKPAARYISESSSVADPHSDLQNVERKARRTPIAKRSYRPLFYLAAVLFLFVLVLQVLKKYDRNAKSNQSIAAISPIVPVPKVTPRATEDSRFMNLSSTTPEPPPSLPDGMPAVVQGKAAIRVLEKFLASKTLAERLPLIETEISEADLATSVLAGKLPVATFIELDTTETNAIEQLTDYYHKVNLQLENNEVSQQTILVRKRGGSEPKVIIDPFLDTFGGKLAAYAKAPVEQAATFRIVASPIASCNDENIPAPEKKMTLRLLARSGSKEITRAYFSRQSKIAQMLEDGTYDFNFSSAKPCTLMVRWNAEENAEMPYLEAISLKALNWNP
jgi:hypothetical protein